MKRPSLNRVLSPLLFATMMATSAEARDWAKERLDKSPRHSEWVNLKHDQREVNSFIVFPEVKNKATAVVIVHEIFGLTDWARTVADRLAEVGYIAIAPDLLSGMGSSGGGTDALGGRDAVTKAVSSLPPDQVAADLNAAVDYVSKLPACNGKVVIAGFCWGGGQAFRFATTNKAVKAAFVFYGTAPEKQDEIARIVCPVYGFYGGSDARVSATIPTTIELMHKDGKTYEPVTYEGAGHGFMRAGEEPNATEANKKAHDDAWIRWKELLQNI
jgi:carboxymethylenebutenolidase